MTRTLKALGLALLAVCALSAVAASSASAEGTKDKLTCTEVQTCDITAEGTATFGTKSSSISITCKKEVYHGTISTGATEVTVTPTYSECSSPVDVDKCHYKLTGTTTTHLKTDGVTNETDAGVHLECEPGGTIKITVSGCTLTISGPQSLHGVAYDNKGSGSTEDVEVTTTVDNIHYTSSGFLCAFGGIPSTGTDGYLTGPVTAKGFIDTEKETTVHTPIGVDS